MPLIDEALNPIDENFDFTKQIGASPSGLTPNLPVDIDNIDPLGFRDNPGQMTIPNAKPIHFDQRPMVDKPGFFKTFGHAVLEYNELVNAGKFINQTVDNVSHLNDVKPDDWRPDTLEAVDGISQRYWPHIWDAVSPKDQAARREYSLEQMKDEQYYASGSMVVNLAGGLVGGISSPSTWLIPMAAGIKYAKFGENIIKNVWNASPALALSSIATEGMYQAGHAGGNMQDWAIDSLRDIVFGGALIGGAAGIGAVLRGGELYAARKTVNYAFKGVDLNPVVEDGVYKGIKASAAPNMAASAKLVEEAQIYADNTLNRSGALKYIPGFDFLAGNRVLGSPIIRGLTSPYNTMRGFVDRIAAHGVETVKTARGEARPLSAEEILGRSRAEAKIVGSAIRGLYYEANGLSSKDTAANALKNLKQSITQDKRISQADFGKAVRGVINTDAPHALPQINEAAKIAIEFAAKIGKEFTDSHGWEEGFLKPRTAANYIMQNYNLGEIRTRPEDFMTMVAEGVRGQDELIGRLSEPVREAEARVQQLRETMESPAFMDETRTMAREIEAAKADLKREQNLLLQSLENNEDYHILLEDRVFLNSQDRAELNSLLEPKRNLEKEVTTFKDDLRDLKEKRSRIKDSLSRNKKPETRKNNQKLLDYTEKAIKEVDEKLNVAKGKVEDEIFRLQNEARAGGIKRKLFEVNSEANEIKFRDPSATPRFRKVHESHDERMLYARQLRETILGNTAESLNNAVLEGMTGTAVESPQYLKKRTVMLPSELFNANGFLDPDIGKALSAYANTMSRHTALKRAFRGNVTEPGIKGVLDSLLKEKRAKEAKILEKPESAERTKEINQHEKEYQKTVAMMTDMHDAFMGRVGDPKIRRYTQSLKNYAAATLLGGVPLSQISDLGAIVLKHGMYPFLMQGLRPMLKSMNGTLKSAEGTALKQNSAHALVSIEHLVGNAQGKFMDSDLMSDVPLYGRLASSIDTAAHVSGNLYGTNYVENWNQSMVANITQSKIMKAAFDFSKGNITEKQLREMAHLGIDIKTMADRFINGFKESKGWEELGGYQSKYYDWNDLEAAKSMSEAVYRSVYDTVIQRGMFSSPLWTNDPIMGLLFTFHGWAYSAFTRYTVPILQRPDAQTALGVATMFSLGMLIEPLRQWANGKEVNLDDEHFFLKAFDNSGLGSAWSDTFNTLNLLMGQELIPGMASERRKEISVLGALGGPVGGSFEMGMGVLRDAWTGKISQQTTKNAARLLGLNQHLLLRRAANQFNEATGLPEKRGDAEAWPWWQALNGE